MSNSIENIYQNAKIYKIISYSHPDLVYYGSTTQSLSMRMAGHRSHFKSGNTCSSREILKYEDAKIELVEEYPCTNKMQLNKKEGEYITKNECVNKNVPGRTMTEYIKQYYDDNKDKIKTYQHAYQNTDEYKAKQKEYQATYRAQHKKNIQELEGVEKECIQSYNKLYYIKKKEKIGLIKCAGCAMSVAANYLPKHEQSSYHQRFVKALEEATKSA